MAKSLSFHFFCSIALISLCLSSHAGIYQWVDENGQIHFGDQPDTNSQKSVNVLDIKTKQHFPLEVHFTYVNHQQHPDTEQKTAFAIRKMRDMYSNVLGLELHELDSFNVKIFGSQKEFAVYRDRYYPNSETATGLYSAKNNEAIVWQNRDFQSMLGVVIHEMSHALLRMALKTPPRWVNEGLAEYFESMQVSGQSVTLKPQLAWKDTVKDYYFAGHQIQLADLVSWDWKQWLTFNQNHNLSYASSWSLTHFLMSSDAGKHSLKQYLQDLDQSLKNKQNLDDAASFEASYPGGLKALQTEWENWLTRDFIASHTY